MGYWECYPASRVSFNLPRSVGKRKETLRGSSTFCIEHAVNSNVFGSQSRVTSNHKTKTNSRDIFEELWQTHDNQGIISFENQDSSVFTEKINRLLNSGKLVSVTDIRRKYSWELRQ